MALFKILQGPDVNLHGDGTNNNKGQSLHEGYCYFTTDKNLFYVDYKKIIDGKDTIVRSPLNAQNAYGLYNYDGDVAVIVDSIAGAKEDEIPTTKAVYDYFLDENDGVLHLKMDKADPSGTGSFGLNVNSDITLGENAVALNSGNAPTAKNTFCAGEGTVSNAEGQFAIGKFNELNTAYSFVIGGGSSATDRKNIFSVDWDGNATLEKTLSISDPTQDDLDNHPKPNSFAATRGYVKNLVEQTVQLVVIKEA